jgi:GWxTD domain-containing protein
LLRFRSFLFALLIAALFASILPASASRSERNTPPTYRHWIDVEVPYIISSIERKQFLSLSTDQERDSFIAAFWRVRNPNPDSDANAFKDEHYRRLAYANEHFGTAKYEDGWRTDMGRIYIILGPPKQRAPYHAKENLREMEIWFYEAETPALPPYFNVLFYKPSPIDSYRIYSPTQDGPVALVTTGRSRNDNLTALTFLRKSAGDEVAKTAITLLPDEAASFDRFEPNMDSDMMLATINDLPDNPLVKEHMESNRLREHVTSSMLTGDQSLTLGSAVFRDDQGRETVSYLLSSASPDPRIIGRHPDGSLYYDLALRTSVLTSAGKPVYDQEDQLIGKLTEAQADLARKKKFAAEGRIPLSPGTYTVVATLTNNVDHVATRQHASITVPVTKSQSVKVSELIAYTAPAGVMDSKGQLPFSISKVRFTPRGAQSVYMRAGEKLPLVFQLWLDPKTDGATTATDKVHIHYVFGGVTASHESPSMEDEDIDVANRDKAGNLLTGHTLDTSGLAPGTYRLVVGANIEGARQSAYAAMTLHVERGADHVDTWTAYGAVDPGGVALDDFKRGLSAEAQGGDAEAQEWYTKALAENPKDMRALDKLVALLDRLGKSEELASLSQQSILSETATAPKTLLSISQALTKVGNPKAQVRLLETQIKLQPPNEELYLSLAKACEATGDLARARDLRGLAKGIQ